MANHSGPLFLHAPYSYQITVSRQIYFHTATLSVPSVFSTEEAVLFPSPLYSPDQTWGPTFLPSRPSLSLRPSLHSSLFYPRLIEVSGGSSEVTGVRLPATAVCLSNEPETQGGSAYYGDEEIQAGQKVRDLANRGPHHHPLPPSYLSFPLFSSPLLLPPSFLPSRSLVCPARSNEGARMLNRSCGLLLVLLFPPHPLLSFSLYLFILEVV